MQVNQPYERISLTVVTGDVVPSFKNSKRSILDSRTGLQRTLTPKPIKKRMQALEDGIVSALSSLCRTGENATDLEWQRRRRTVLSEQLRGLSDDSLKQIPEFSFGVEYVTPDQAGVRIEIESMEDFLKVVS